MQIRTSINNVGIISRILGTLNDGQLDKSLIVDMN